MKKLLILSYHFPPMNVIASRRTEAYAMFLKQSNIHPTIVTHHWDSGGLLDVRKEVVKEEYENYTVIRVPNKKTFAGKLQNLIKKIPLGLNLLNLGFWLLGHLDTEAIDSYFNYRKFLRKHLCKYRYDAVLAVYSPSHHVRMASEIYKKHGTPYIADYRDLWDNGLLMRTPYKASFGTSIRNYISKKYHREWLRNASFITSVSQPLADYFKELTGNVNSFRITNGYETGLFDSLEKLNVGKFLILYGGTIYYNQDISPFIEGLKIFWNNLTKEKRQLVSIVMMGIRNPVKMNQLITSLPGLPFTFTERVSRPEALQMMKDASILFFPAYPTHRGIYSGKIFEYLGSGNNILVTPTDNDVVEELIEQTGAGIATSDPKKVEEYLTENFQYWLQHGITYYKGNPSVIAEYSREYQVGKMASLINNFLESSTPNIDIENIKIQNIQG